MKRKELYNYIKEEIINELSEDLNADKAAFDAQKNAIDKKIISLQKKKAEMSKNNIQSLEEKNELEEMARTPNKIKLGDPSKVELVKKLYGGTWKGNMLDVVEKAGEDGISQLDLALAVGKSSQPAINPAVNEFIKVGAFAFTKIKDTTPTSEPESKSDDTEKDEWDIAAEKDEWDTSADDKDETDEKDPSTSDIKSSEKAASKITGGKGYAKELSPEDEDRYNRIKTGIETKVAKIAALPKNKRSSSSDMSVLKTLIKRDDVKKLFKAKGVNLNALVSDIID